MNIHALYLYAWNKLQQRAQTLVKELGRDSSWLKELHDRFVGELQNANIKSHVISLYETVRSKTMMEDPRTGEWCKAGRLEEVVSRSSATLQIGEEYETEIDVARDHSEIAKVTREEDHVYHILLHQLEELITNSVQNDENTQLFHSDSLAGSPAQSVISIHSIPSNSILSPS